MTLHTLGIVTFGLLCANEARGFVEKQEWPPTRIVLGVPASLATWVFVVWAVFFS